MFQAITEHGMFHNDDNNMGLYNFLENKEATPEQSHDLLSLREIGQKGFEHIVTTQYLRGTSTNAPVRKKGSVHSLLINVKNSG